MISTFIANECVGESSQKILSSCLYSHYLLFIHRNPSERPISNKAFTQKIRVMYPDLVLKHSNRGQMWHGITHSKYYTPPIAECEKREQARLHSQLYQHQYYITHKVPKAEQVQRRELQDQELVFRCGFGDVELRSKAWREHKIIQYGYNSHPVVDWVSSIEKTLHNRAQFLRPFQEQELERLRYMTSLAVAPPLAPMTPSKRKPTAVAGNSRSSELASESVPKVRIIIRNPSQPRLSTHELVGCSGSRLTDSHIPPANAESPGVLIDVVTPNRCRDKGLSSNEVSLAENRGSSIRPIDNQAPTAVESSEFSRLTAPTSPTPPVASTPLMAAGMLPKIPSSLEFQAKLCDSSSHMASGSTEFLKALRDTSQQPRSAETFGPQTLQSILPRPLPSNAITMADRKSMSRKSTKSVASKTPKPSRLKSEASPTSRDEYLKRREEYQKTLDAQFKLYNKAEAQAIHHGGSDLSRNREVQKLANAILKWIRDWGHVTQPEPAIPTLSSKKYSPQRMAQVEKEYDAFTVWYNEEEDRLTLGYTDDTLYYFLEDYDWSHQGSDQMIQRLQQRRGQVESWYSGWVDYGVKG